MECLLYSLSKLMQKTKRFSYISAFFHGIINKKCRCKRGVKSDSFVLGHFPIKLGENAIVMKNVGRRGRWPYIYICIYAVKLLSGPSLAILGVITWAK